ncbi:MAG: NAD(P)/FAD-dependent oxidoreductase [Planctomycetales bacterium]|nr:NAD(P)/FAD-dependent oxidoreductase [Planctomycetales bacterium]
MTENLVVVGNGMASQAFCRCLTDWRNVHERFNLTVIGDENHLAYDRVHLSSLFNGKTASDLQLEPADWYNARKIRVVTGQTVRSIDRFERTVHTDLGTAFSYDKLVIATGSRPFVPPIAGTDLEGVFLYRTIDDAHKIANAGASCDSAAVLGGGLLGLEAAKALHDMGIVTHVVEMAPGLMPRQLDRLSASVLKSRVERMGVKVHVTKRTESIEKHGDYLILRFDTGESLSVKMVVVSAGVRPRDELGRQAELEIGSRGGIVVDDSLQTSDSNIYAIGECVSHHNTVYGLVAPCQEMTQVLAERLNATSDLKFQSGDRSAQLKLLGIDVFTFGEPLGESSEAQLLTYQGDLNCRSVLVRNKRLVGAIGVGEWPEAARIRTAITSSRRLKSWEINRFQNSGFLWRGQNTLDSVRNWPPESIICSCKKISQSDIVSAIQGGCLTVADLREKTSASSVCGSCQGLLNELVGDCEKEVSNVAGWRGLMIASAIALVALSCVFVIGPIDYSSSVADARHQIDFIWRDGFSKQISGFALLGVMLASLLLSLRKRIPKLTLGQFATWRTAHAILGCITVFGILAHTGFHMGSNLNFWLMSCFIGVNLIGALTGLVSSVESRVGGQIAIAVRRWRPRFTLLHIFMFWPLPVLITAHVFSVYFC